MCFEIIFQFSCHIPDINLFNVYSLYFVNFNFNLSCFSLILQHLSMIDCTPLLFIIVLALIFQFLVNNYLFVLIISEFIFDKSSIYYNYILFHNNYYEIIKLIV